MEKTKRCPYCGEEIMATAKKCRHCNEWLVKEAMPAATTGKKEKKDDDDLSAGSIALVGGFLLLFWGGVAVGIVMLLHFTVPNSSRMEKCIKEEVAELTASQVSDLTDQFGGSELGDLARLFMDTDEVSDEVIKSFNRYNSIEVEESYCWSVAYIHNSKTSEDGEIGSFGILGIVIPLVEWEDFVLQGSD